MKRMELIVILLALSNLVWCFNLDPKTAQIRIDMNSSNTDSYFGYAVQFYNRSDTLRLIVGAPKTRSAKDAKHPSGAVQDCIITGGRIEHCEPIKLYQKETEESTWNASKLSYNKYKKDAWIGGALSVNENTRIMTVCGAQRENLTHLNGVCYILPDMHKWKNKDITKTLFLLNKNEQIYNKTDEDGLQYIVTIPFYSLQEAGIFVRSFDDETIVGTPGVFHLKGNDRDQNKEQSTNDSVLDSYFTNDTLFQSYFGYSIVGGKFFKNQTKSYIFGTPSVGNYTGNVFVFDIPKNWNGQKITPKLSWKGQQMGEYFGQAVCVADLNKDGYDDILVGAPRHSGNKNGETRGDEGKVYVFLNTREGHFRERDDLVGSRISGAMFGSAISFIGDLDHDGFPEIAVGAPHEYSSADNTGCIYIYKAGKDGVSTKYVQRIRAQDVGIRIRGFGISISNGFDIDDNSFNDISVGAHKSGHVILIKSKPLVNVYHSVNRSDSSVFEIQEDTTQFDLQICVKYDVPYTNFPKNLNLNIKVTVEKNRAYFNSLGGKKFTLTYNATLEIEKFSCTNKTVYLNVDYFKNVSTHYSPLLIGLNYSAAENLFPKICLACPVMNQSQSWHHAIEIPVEPKCDYGTCCREWTISAELPELKEPFTIGSQFSTPLTVEVVNNGVISTLRHIQIDLPNETSLLNIPHEFKCSPIQENSWKCLNDMMFPTERKKILKFDLNIWISKIGSGFAHFNVSLFCSNETKTYRLSLKLKDQSLKVSAEANPTNIDSDITGGNAFVTLTHDYRIFNSGISKRVHFKCGIPENLLWTNSTLPLLESHNLTVISKQDSSCNIRRDAPYVKRTNELQSPPAEDIFTYTYGYLYYDCSASVDAEGLDVQIKVQISVEALDLLLKNSTYFNYNTFITIFHETEGELKESVGTRFNTASRQWPFYILWSVLVILVVILVVGILHCRKHRLTTYDFRPSILLRLEFL